MTATTPDSVRDYRSTLALNVALPPAERLPASVRKVTAAFAALKTAALEAEAEELMLAEPTRDQDAAEADHALLAAGQAPENVKKLQLDRAQASARATAARRALHENWYDVTEPALSDHAEDIRRHGATRALAACADLRRAVNAIPEHRGELQLSLHVIELADVIASRREPNWIGDPYSGSVELARETSVGRSSVHVLPRSRNELIGRSFAEVDEVEPLLHAIADPDRT